MVKSVTKTAALLAANEKPPIESKGCRESVPVVEFEHTSANINEPTERGQYQTLRNEQVVSYDLHPYVPTEEVMYEIFNYYAQL